MSTIFRKKLIFNHSLIYIDIAFYWQSKDFFHFFLTANSEPLSSSSVTADTVKNYLGEHPEFLDTYIQQNVNSDTIEQWISKKPQTLSPIQSKGRTSATTRSTPPLAPTPPPRPSSSTSMPMVSPPKNNNISTSTTKVPLSATTGKKKEKQYLSSSFGHI